MKIKEFVQSNDNQVVNIAHFVSTVRDMQGFYISCIEEISWRHGFIFLEQLHKFGEAMSELTVGRITPEK